MFLTKQQKEILIGTILGDGTLEMNGNNVRLRVEHSLNQEDYLLWKYERFNDLATSKPRIVQSYHKLVDKSYEKLHFSTNSIEILNKYREMFYQKGTKIIPNNIRELLYSPLSLAVWFMDDGYKRNDCNALRISTDSFNKKEQELLVECLKDNYSINSKLHKKGKSWNIYIPQAEARKFCNIIKPYIIPIMNYKIALTP